MFLFTYLHKYDGSMNRVAFFFFFLLEVFRLEAVHEKNIGIRMC